MKIWSEQPAGRAAEIAADGATLLWLLLWGTVGWKVFSFLVQLAGTGRVLRDGGENLNAAGRQLAGALGGIPLVGEGAASNLSGAFGSAARPLITFGSDLERLLIIVAALLTLLLVLAALTPWLTRYLPWRIARLRRLRAAHRVLRRSPPDWPVRTSTASWHPARSTAWNTTSCSSTHPIRSATGSMAATRPSPERSWPASGCVHCLTSFVPGRPTLVR